MEIFILWSFLSAGMGNKEPAKTEEEAQFCTMEVKECEDGSYVGRDSEHNCEFKECPHSKKKAEEKN